MRNNKASQRRLEKNVNPYEVLDTQVYKLILKGWELTSDWKDKFIAIALSCGARLIEIAAPGVSKFSESLDPMGVPNGLLHQEGVAKDEHGAKIRGAERHVHKPVIQIQAWEVVMMIQTARAM